VEFEPDSISAAAAAVVAASHKRSHEEPIVTPDEHGAYGYAHLPFVFPVVLDANAEELNERPRATLGFLTPREALERLLVASAP